MTRRRLVLFAAGLSLLAAAFVGADRLLAASATRLLAQLRAGPLAGAEFSYAGLSTSLWRREVVLTGLKFNDPRRQPIQQLTAQSVSLQGLPWLGRERVELGQIRFTGMSVSGEVAFKATELELDQPGLAPPVGEAADWLHAVSFASMQAQDVEVSSGADSLILAELKAGALTQGRLSHLAARQVKLVHGSYQLEATQINGEDIALPLWRETLRRDELLPLFYSDMLRQGSVGALTVQRQNQPLLQLAGAQLQAQANAQGIRTQLQVVISDMLVDPTGLPADLARTLAGLGYTQIEGDARLVADYDPASRVLRVTGAELTLPNALSLQLQLQVGEVYLPGVSRSSQLQAMNALAAAQVLGLEFRLRDDSLIRRYVKREADRLQVEPPVYVEQRLEALRPQTLAVGAGGQKLGQVYRSLGAFMMNPGEFVLTATPASPVPVFGLFMNAARLDILADVLNLKAISHAP